MQIESVDTNVSRAPILFPLELDLGIVKVLFVVLSRRLQGHVLSLYHDFLRTV